MQAPAPAVCTVVLSIRLPRWLGLEEGRPRAEARTGGIQRHHRALSLSAPRPRVKLRTQESKLGTILVHAHMRSAYRNLCLLRNDDKRGMTAPADSRGELDEAGSGWNYLVLWPDARVSRSMGKWDNPSDGQNSIVGVLDQRCALLRSWNQSSGDS
ncbi:hypothetical protein Micbo1qcDRAFT_174069 [Microdochium bolleyi]|uniref:Uncharacterized protein n=1 Tax=Microdochium bolleyi TaxID=196109 RepID=A0A136J6Y3_9PEZI|nr:hypothetical protein Micbo1qcDRAFT_174069 [Microdochium bolleyi]